MKWYEIVGAAGFWFVIAGLGGLGGAIEFGTGWEASMAFLGFGSFFLGIAMDEYAEKKESAMVYQLENHMVVDREWEQNTPLEVSEKLRGVGYTELGTGIFVPEDDAYEYAMERISLDEDLKQEFKVIFMEWFYSGNWVKEE